MGQYLFAAHRICSFAVRNQRFYVAKPARFQQTLKPQEKKSEAIFPRRHGDRGPHST